MSANSSTPSPTSGSRLHDEDDDNDLTADLDLGFDGAEDLLRVWRQGLRPDPNLTVSEWADQHRWLSSRGAAEPGRAAGAAGSAAGSAGSGSRTGMGWAVGAGAGASPSAMGGSARPGTGCS